MNTLLSLGLVSPQRPNGERRRKTLMETWRKRWQRSDLNPRHFDFLGIRQSTVDCDTTYSPDYTECFDQLGTDFPSTMELDSSTCSDCLWKQRELRMTKEDYRDLKNHTAMGKSSFCTLSEKQYFHFICM